MRDYYLADISGGGLYYGNINEVTNEPDGLIAQSVANGLPVVYVAMNYRLNGEFPISSDTWQQDSAVLIRFQSLASL